ncbi:UDP-N-acetylmuramoyl-tripeptide--D-alanyl-D-alanine ligase [Anaerolineales bacterium HSG6]|nr:UDP-N-acetylmuramoyl-tripeptide--D-alanyl-D-alanine ligase [Anaerolineales bacterium HSG6]MDM8529645.1 UDP-N-acetylmuramoyl-tripeptide--D-alanyl-D-alanine ligase [Anaerolineales bacterium HSG25]
MVIADIIEALTDNRIEARQPITQVVIDSRQAEQDSLFVALPGENSDGHEFVEQAFRQGATVALTHRPVELSVPHQHIKVDEPLPQTIDPNQPLCIETSDSLVGLQQFAKFWRQKFDVRVVAITGSVGKSTTKELTASVLSTRYNLLKSEGNYNNEIGLPLTLLNLTSAHERVVLEMGMYDLGEITLLCELAQPHVGVVTNVGPVHLERLGTIERIAQAKTELVSALPPYNSQTKSVAILNYDDPYVRGMVPKTKAAVMSYGLTPSADLWASDVTSAGLDGIRFVFNQGTDTIHARVPLLGRHSVHTALRAALVGLVEGLAWGDIITGLQNLPAKDQLRLVWIPGPNGSILLDDSYNANPASTIAALNMLDDLSAPKKIAVLGDMLELGHMEEAGHRKVGCRAARVVDLLITIGDRAQIIAEEAEACGLNSSKIIQLPDNQAAIDLLEAQLAQNEIVLIKGSNSQKMDQIVSNLTRRSISE